MPHPAATTFIEPRYLNVTVDFALQTNPGRPGFISTLRRLLPGVSVRWLAELDSTSSELRRQLEADAVDGPALQFTDRQTGGRGTRGREWVQPDSTAGLDLALTLAAPLPALWRAEPRLSLAIGAQLALALEAASGLQLGLKWPNDLLLFRGGQWRKCGGLLLETLPYRGAPWLLCGIGVNVNSAISDFPAELQARLATLADTHGLPIDRDALQVTAAQALCAMLLADPPLPLDAVLAAWQSRDQTRAMRCVLLRDGRRIPVAAEGVDLTTGALRVRLPGGAVTLVYSHAELETGQGVAG